MPTNVLRSRALRQFAAEYLQGLADNESPLESDHADLVNSLVRQWLTYDNNAALYLGDRLLYLVLSHTPLGRFSVDLSRNSAKWKQAIEDWKIDPDELPNLISQLNLAQSAELTNNQGMPLRFWIDPKKRSRGVEKLVKPALPLAPPKRDYRKIASNALLEHLGNSVAPDEMDELTSLVATQLREYQGNACIILNADKKFVLTITEKNDGCCNVVASRRAIDLNPMFASLGFAKERVPELIGRLNRGDRVKFLNRTGIPGVLWINPKAGKVEVARPSVRPQ